MPATELAKPEIVTIIKSVEKDLDDLNAGSLTEEEAAAAMAAIAHFLEDEECESQAAGSAWQASFRLRANGIAHSAPLRKSWLNNLWRSATYPLLAILITCLTSLIPAVAIAPLEDSAPDEHQGNDSACPASAVGSDPDQSQTGSRSGILRVAVSLGSTHLDLTPVSDIEIRDPGGKTIVSRLRGGQSYGLHRKGHRLSISLPGRHHLDLAFRAPAGDFVLVSKTYPDAGARRAELTGLRLRRGDDGLLILPALPGCPIVLNGRAYRGLIWLRPASSNPQLIDAINLVNLEDYLKSVVAAEMPSDWPIEALKAQAIASRSYAVASIGKHDSEGYDIKASGDDQVYSGMGSESEPAARAVAETRGMVIKHAGQVIPTFFHSTSGGFTERAEYVWGEELPYLKSVPDCDGLSPYSSWTKDFSVADLEQMFCAWGQSPGHLLDIWLVSRSPSMRIRQALIIGSNAVRVVKGEELRRFLKLPSTNFNLTLERDTYRFTGRGFGHGLGMSQWGARALALNGYNADQILAYYYKEVSLERI